MRLLAWVLGGIGAVACVAGAAVVVSLGAPRSFLLIYVVGILMALLGALVASRAPHNSIGWLMIASSIATSLAHLPAGYSYAALVVHHGHWPLGGPAAWFGAWSWVPVLITLPLISTRFPDGKVRPGWRVVDWLAISGTFLFSLGIGLSQLYAELQFMPLPLSEVDTIYSRMQQLPFAVPREQLAAVQGTGLFLMLTSFVGAAASLIARFRKARGDERQQLKWFAYSGSLLAASLVYGGVAWNFFGQPLYEALTPLELAALTLPLAIGIAILRHRLYDIDLLINRTLVYGIMTAVLAAAYTAGITLFQRLYVASTGQKSDAAYVLTAFGLVVVFSPMKEWLQHRVDSRMGHRSPQVVLDDFRTSVDAVVAVMDVHQVACRFLDRAVTAFEAKGAVLYLGSNHPVYGCGDMNGGPHLEVSLRHEGRSLGRLVLAERRGHIVYAERDRDALQRSADSVGEALALAAHYGHQPLTGRVAHGPASPVRS